MDPRKLPPQQPQPAQQPERDKNVNGSDEPWANGTADAFSRTEEPFNESSREISDEQLDEMLGDI